MTHTPNTLAARWGVSEETVRALCRRGKLAHFKIGHMFRIPQQAVVDYECQKSESQNSCDAVFPD